MRSSRRAADSLVAAAAAASAAEASSSGRSAGVGVSPSREAAITTQNTKRLFFPLPLRSFFVRSFVPFGDGGYGVTPGEKGGRAIHLVFFLLLVGFSGLWPCLTSDGRLWRRRRRRLVVVFPLPLSTVPDLGSPLASSSLFFPPFPGWRRSPVLQFSACLVSSSP